MKTHYDKLSELEESLKVFYRYYPTFINRLAAKARRYGTILEALGKTEGYIVPETMALYKSRLDDIMGYISESRKNKGLKIGAEMFFKARRELKTGIRQIKKDIQHIKLKPK